ncbi:DUF4843 domain-containing protein [Pedobacter sp. UBA5917]|jgi:hypothetical protein|uniref:DUF4843 domain-containing protein n=1 Tax=Pedobacter sp. UBA5917 TaxID=1947061 RepID=UPI0025F7BB2B|nr:DUF4843 domain-containing protein [Pedobacter sp. UBA5917]
MKRLTYSLAAILISVTAISCSKTQGLLYSDVARVQLNDTATVSSTFVYDAPTITRDTIYIQVNTIGEMANVDRAVKFVQVNNKTDLFPAVSGQHFVPFDDPSIKNLMVIKANTVKAKIPVILLRDASLKTNTYRLRLQLAANDQFALGEVQSRSTSILFSDRLERFYSWRVDNGAAPAFYTLGKYSTRKHQFMIDVLHEQIDEAWYQTMVNLGAQQHYGNTLKTALAKFNNDPVNIASGKAPLRETDEVGSLPITFP